ncbi:MAG: cytochrome b/b6 domain-containing protein [Shewanella sp.]|nr:cytochrome b/b6 domain-containing protein [Shewanella sp.]
MAELHVTVHKVWDRPRRIFHWLNLFFILALTFVGLIMLNKSALGISGLEAKIALKTLHVILGYGFAVNLILRLLWGWLGHKHPSLRIGQNPIANIVQYQSQIRQHQKPQYLGHNPLGKIAVILMFVLMSIIMMTGLLRAGTDIYYPPFGSSVQKLIVSADSDPRMIKPYDDQFVDKQSVAQLKPYKSVVGKIHLYSVYLLLLMIAIHIIAVIKAEITLQPGLISAMVSGKKLIKGKAEDERN